MKATPFDSAADLAPLPFERGHCEMAAALETAGLPWRPHVGCFVWDPEKQKGDRLLFEISFLPPRRKSSLSPYLVQDRRLRFFQPIKELAPEISARLTQLDYDREMAFVVARPGVPGKADL